MPRVRDANMNVDLGNTRMSFIALNRIVEERTKRDADYRRSLTRPLLSHARELTEAELFEKLERVGISLDKSTYAKIAEHAFSAEEICKTAITTEVRSRFKNRFDEDWIWFALTILWERWFPQWPNFEQLDDRIQAGYALAESDPSAACDQWSKAWEAFLLLYNKGSFTSIQEFDEAFGGTQFVSNWISDFETEMGNAAVNDAGWHERRAHFCEEFLRQFPGVNSLTRENMRCALAEAIFNKGDRVGGDALFEQWLAEDPQWGWGWIGWSDCYFLFAHEANCDLERAEALLKQGLATPAVRDREDLLERLADICREQGNVEEAHKFQTESATARRANFRSEEAVVSQENPEQMGEVLDRPTPARPEKVGRNEPCPCGSGKKYKKCCLAQDEERTRQAYAAQVQKQREADSARLSSNEDRNSGEAVDEYFDSASLREDEPELPPEVKMKLDRLWNDFEAADQPSVGRMDEFLSQLLSLPPEATLWSDILHWFAQLNHPDLPGVFHRITAAVPHTNASGMGFFYWAAAEEFTRHGASHLLSEVAAGFRRLDRGSYDADALAHVEDFLLAAGLEAETLQLAEHFLPIERADDELMSWSVPNRCSLIFELRVGQALRNGPSVDVAPDALAKQLRSNIEEEVHEASARLAAEIASRAGSDTAWERSQFDLVTGDISRDERAWQDSLRLFGTIIRVAREAWLLEARPPGCALRGLTLLLNSVYDWKEQRNSKSKRPKDNLLDYLVPAGLESRLVQSCRDLIGVNAPRARLLLQAHELLAHSAARHQLVTSDALALTHKELSRLRRKLDEGT